MDPKDLDRIVTTAIASYKGDAHVLESAIGALMVGLLLGRKPLLLIHGGSAIRRYQDILNIEFRSVMPDEGPLCHKSEGYKLAQKVGQFWASVRGSAPGRSSELAA